MSSIVSILSKFYDEYRQSTPKKLKLVDSYLFCVMLTGIIQFAYCALVGTFPFNSFLSGFISTIGCFVLGDFQCTYMDIEKCKNAVKSGIISGCITAVIFQPLEVLKTRMQQSTNVNRTMFTIIRQSLQRDGVLVFWNGLTPALYRSVPVISVYFASIETFRNMNVFKTNNMLVSYMTGGLARAISDISVYPLALIKTRYESDFYKYPNIRTAFKSIVRENGLSGLYKGLNATLIRDINYSGIYYMFYIQMKSRMGKADSTKHIAAYALASGFLACLLTQPPDVIRTRMQLNPIQCKTITKTIRLIFNQSGFNGFFVGFIPRAGRRILISVLSWTIFEKLSFKE